MKTFDPKRLYTVSAHPMLTGVHAQVIGHAFGKVVDAWLQENTSDEQPEPSTCDEGACCGLCHNFLGKGAWRAFAIKVRPADKLLKEAERMAPRAEGVSKVYDEVMDEQSREAASWN